MKKQLATEVEVRVNTKRVAAITGVYLALSAVISLILTILAIK